MHSAQPCQCRTASTTRGASLPVSLAAHRVFMSALAPSGGSTQLSNTATNSSNLRQERGKTQSQSDFDATESHHTLRHMYQLTCPLEEQRVWDPLPKIVLQGERLFYASGDTAEGKVLFHSQQPYEIQMVNITLKIGSRTSKRTGIRPMREISPHSSILTSAVLFAKEKVQRDTAPLDHRNTSTWDFRLTIPSHASAKAEVTEESSLTWARNDTFIDSSGTLELPSTLSTDFLASNWEHSRIYMSVYYHLKATITYLDKLGQSKEAVVVEPVVLTSPHLSDQVVRTCMPLTKHKKSFMGRVSLIIGHASSVSKHPPPRIFLERGSTTSTSLNLRIADPLCESRVSNTRLTYFRPPILHKATVKFTETIDARTIHHQSGFLGLGDRVYNTSHSAIISKSSLNLAVPRSTAEETLDLEHVMDTNFADLIAPFHPTMSTINIKISHRFIVCLEFRVDEERYDLRLEQSFKVLRKMPVRAAKAVRMDVSADSYFRQDSAVDGVLCGDDMRHSFAAPKRKRIDAEDNDGVHRKDWSIW